MIQGVCHDPFRTLAVLLSELRTGGREGVLSFFVTFLKRLLDSALGWLRWRSVPCWNAYRDAALCCLCLGDWGATRAGAGEDRPEAGDSKEGFLAKLKKMFSS